jgi:hypothetical protein
MEMSGRNVQRGSLTTNGDPSPVVPFLLGTAVGGLAGAVVGTLLSGHAVHLFATLIDVVERRGDEERRPKFELLLQ